MHLIQRNLCHNLKLQLHFIKFLNSQSQRLILKSPNRSARKYKKQKKKSLHISLKLAAPVTTHPRKSSISSTIGPQYENLKNGWQKNYAVRPPVQRKASNIRIWSWELAWKSLYASLAGAARKKDAWLKRFGNLHGVFVEKSSCIFQKEPRSANNSWKKSSSLCELAMRKNMKGSMLKMQNLELRSTVYKKKIKSI